MRKGGGKNGRPFGQQKEKEVFLSSEQKRCY
jgi:hypothetical protein